MMRLVVLVLLLLALSCTIPVEIRTTHKICLVSGDSLGAPQDTVRCAVVDTVRS